MPIDQQRFTEWQQPPFYNSSHTSHKFEYGMHVGYSESTGSPTHFLDEVTPDVSVNIQIFNNTGKKLYVQDRHGIRSEIGSKDMMLHKSGIIIKKKYSFTSRALSSMCEMVKTTKLIDNSEAHSLQRFVNDLHKNNKFNKQLPLYFSFTYEIEGDQLSMYEDIIYHHQTDLVFSYDHKKIVDNEHPFSNVNYRLKTFNTGLEVNDLTPVTFSIRYFSKDTNAKTMYFTLAGAVYALVPEHVFVRRSIKGDKADTCPNEYIEVIRTESVNETRTKCVIVEHFTIKDAQINFGLTTDFSEATKNIPSDERIKKEIARLNQETELLKGTIALQRQEKDAKVLELEKTILEQKTKLEELKILSSERAAVLEQAKKESDLLIKQMQQEQELKFNKVKADQEAELDKLLKQNASIKEVNERRLKDVRDAMISRKDDSNNFSQAIKLLGPVIMMLVAMKKEI